MSTQNERRLSLNGKNAYISLTEDSTAKNIYDPMYNKNYLTAKPAVNTRPCSPLNKEKISPNKNCVEYNIKENKKNQTQTTTPELKTSDVQTKALDRPLETMNSESSNVFNTSKTVSTNNTTSRGAIPKVRSDETTSNKQAVLPGMLRYISINKRILSPQKGESSHKKQKTIYNPLSNNPYAILSEDARSEQLQNENLNKKVTKPPPIFLREPSSNNLVTTLIELVGKENFHIVPLKKGGVQETKIVIYTEDNYRKISQYFNTNKRNFYTYQLKSSKGLIVVVKGIESGVEPNEIKEALEELGYRIKIVVNIFNKERIPQPLFRVELEPDDKKLKGNEIHPIYSLRYLLNRRINIEEPLKRKGPVQCGNCQEFGHTKNYCTLRTVCAACGDSHSLTECSVIKNGLVKKCGNCGGDHSANYRGCPVYKSLLKRLRERQRLLRGDVNESPVASFIPTTTTEPVVQNQTSKKQTEKFGNQDFPVIPGTFSYAKILKSGNQQPKTATKLSQNVEGLAIKEVSIKPRTATYSSILKSSNHQPNIPQNLGGLEELMYTLVQNVTSLNQNIANFMSSMQSTIQYLLRAQNQMIQILLSKK